MRGQRRTSWRRDVGLLALAATLGFAACDSGASRQAAQVTGPGVTSPETQSVSVAKDKSKGGGDDRGGGSQGKGDDPGQHRGRPEAELRGTVAGKSGACPTITFMVNGVRVRANGATEFEGTSCVPLANGNLVKVEGQPLGNGTVLAREVELLAGAAAAAAAVSGATVALVQGGTVVETRVTRDEGKFEFSDVVPGTYDLRVTRLSASTPCTPPGVLTNGVQLVAERNQVEGRLATTATPATCGTLVLARLEVRQGHGHRD